MRTNRISTCKAACCKKVVIVVVYVEFCYMPRLQTIVRPSTFDTLRFCYALNESKINERKRKTERFKKRGREKRNEKRRQRDSRSLGRQEYISLKKNYDKIYYNNINKNLKMSVIVA